MIETTITIAHPTGLHARPAALFVRTAARFESTVRLRNITRNGNKEADAKSILGLMMLGIEHGHQVLVQADGPDEQAAVDALRALVETNFGEG